MKSRIKNQNSPCVVLSRIHSEQIFFKYQKPSICSRDKLEKTYKDQKFNDLTTMTLTQPIMCLQKHDIVLINCKHPVNLINLLIISRKETGKFRSPVWRGDFDIFSPGSICSRLSDHFSGALVVCYF